LSVLVFEYFSIDTFKQSGIFSDGGLNSMEHLAIFGEILLSITAHETAEQLDEVAICNVFTNSAKDNGLACS
jgi:hypothetical protein